MWLCATRGLAQPVADPTVPDEPAGVEPVALIAQADDGEAVADARDFDPGHQPRRALRNGGQTR